MKPMRFLAILASAFLLSGCNLSGGSGGGSGAGQGEEVDIKTFMQKVEESLSNNDLFVKDGTLKNKEIKGSGNVSFLNKVKYGGNEKETDKASASGSINALIDFNNDIIKGNASYKFDLADGLNSLNVSKEDSYSGQIQGDDGKLYYIDTKENKSRVLLESFTSFKSYLSYASDYLDEDIFEDFNSEYDEFIQENPQIQQLIDSGLLKYYVNGNKFTVKLTGKGSFEFPIKEYDYTYDSDTGVITSVDEKVAYLFKIDISGNYSLKVDLTPGNISYAISGSASVVATIKESIEPLKFGGLFATYIGNKSETKEFFELTNGDSFNMSVSAKVNFTIKDTEKSLEKIAL